MIEGAGLVDGFTVVGGGVYGGGNALFLIDEGDDEDEAIGALLEPGTLLNGPCTRLE